MKSSHAQRKPLSARRCVAGYGCCRGRFVSVLLVLAVGFVGTPALAGDGLACVLGLRGRGVTHGGSVAGCAQVSRSVLRQWFDIGKFLRPGDKSPKRPKSRELQCINPYYFRDQLPKRIPGSSGLDCFQVQGVKACCDRRLEACVTL